MTITKPNNKITPGLILITILLSVLASGCDQNYPPRIIKTEYVRLPGIGTTSFNLRVEASDPDMDPLTYHWEAVQGEFITDADQLETTWKAPVSASNSEYRIIVTVSDGKEQTSDTVYIPVLALTFGKLTGFAYYKDCKVPILGAMVSIDGKRDTTNNKGAFEIDGIRAGRHVLRGEGVDFEAGTTDVLIRTGLNEANVEMASPTLTTKLYGQIMGNVSGDPKPFMTIIILNPDKTYSRLQAIAEDNGYYEIHGIPRGLRYIVVRDDARVQLETSVFLQTSSHNFNVLVREPFNFTDTRDGKEYKAIKISSQIWMAENLAYIPSVTPSWEAGGIWVYGYNGYDPLEAKASANYSIYGCLYSWKTATDDNHGNGKDICPPEWHLPTDMEWKNLEEALGMDPIELDSVGWRYSGEIGRKIKNNSGWDQEGNGTNSGGFGAKPAGSRASTGSFIGLTGYTSFWTATEFTTTDAWRRYLFYNLPAVGRYNDFKTNGYSVRCVKDRN